MNSMVQAPASEARLTPAMTNAAFSTVKSSSQRERCLSSLYNIFHDRKAGDDDGHHPQRHSFEAPLQEAADRLAVVTNQRRNQEETYAARDDRQDYEQAEIVAREPARNGDELVGDRRHALQEDDPRAPGGVQVAELLNALAIAIG